MNEDLNKLSKEELIQKVIALQNESAEKDKTIATLNLEVDSLRDALKTGKSRFFSPKSEKNTEKIFEITVNETEVIVSTAEAEELKDPTAEDLVGQAVAKIKTKGKGKASKKGISKTKRLKNLPVSRQTIHHRFEEGFLKNHPEYVETMPAVYEEAVYIPEHVLIIKHLIHQVTAKNQFTDEGKPVVIQPKDAPKPLHPKPLVSPSMIAKLVTAKYEDCIPLYRLSKHFKSLGADISQQVMAMWMSENWNDYGEAILDRMKKDLKTAKYLHCDETTFPCLEEKRLDGRKSCYVWQVSTGKWEEKQMAVYSYTGNRKRENIQEILGTELEGKVVHSDGYAACFKQDFTNVACFDHIRRKFKTAYDVNADKDEFLNLRKESEEKAVEFLNRPAHSMLKRLLTIIELMGRLYENEKVFTEKGLSPAQIAAERKRLDKPVFEKLDELIEPLCSAEKKKNAAAVSKMAGVTKSIETAADYYWSMREYFPNFINDGKTVLSNIAAEQKMRPLALIRKNSMFFDTKEGARIGMGYMSLTASAKMNGLNPSDYMEYALTRLKDNAYSEELIESVLPYSPKIKERIEEWKEERKKQLAQLNS